MTNLKIHRLSSFCAVFLISLAQMNAQEIQSEEELLSAAFASASGTELTLSQSFTSNADPSVLYFSTLSGNSTVQLIGATDFVSASPILPDDVEYDPQNPVQFTNAEGKLIRSSSSPLLHPLYPNQLNYWFAGPERHINDPLPVPFDYQEGQALGLRIMSGTRPGHHRLNNIRHITPHDGHIVWIAEYLMNDGSTKITWEELPMTRVQCPTFRPRAEIMSTSNYATHLRKLITLEIASAKEMMVPDKSEVLDPRRWTLRPKRFRSEYKANITLTTTEDKLPLADLRQALKNIPINNDGGIEGLSAGEEFIIELPPKIIDTYAEKEGNEILGTIGEDGVIEHLAKLTKNRVFLIGTPGKTIFPALNLIEVARLDFGWITISPFQRRGVEYQLLSLGRNTDVRFYGCVIDDVDASSDGTGNLLGGQKPGSPKKRGSPEQGAWFEFYDGFWSGSEGPTFSYANQNLPDHGQARAIIARSVLDFCNDGFSLYGSGFLLAEGNYFYGGGGRHNSKSGNYQHRDMLGQHQMDPKNSHRIGTAYYNNLMSMGPNLVGRDLAFRGNGSLLMYQATCDQTTEIAGNIFENNKRKRGITGIHKARPDKNFTPGTPWAYGLSIANNIIYERPDNIAGGFTYPVCGFGPVGDGGSDNYVGTANLTSFTGARDGVSGFNRSINWLPEEEAGITGTWLVVKNLPIKRAPKDSSVKKDKKSKKRPARLGEGSMLIAKNHGSALTVLKAIKAKGTLRILVQEIDEAIAIGETFLFDGQELCTLEKIEGETVFKGDREGYLSTAQAFPKWPKISGNINDGYDLDFSQTHYAGSSREGYFSPQDFAVAKELRRFSTDGQSGGPGLPQHGEYLSRYRELPENFNTDLLGYDQAGSLYPNDFYEDWAPQAFSLDAELQNPWKPMPGATAVDKKHLLINTRIASLGTGILAEESADDGSSWTLEVLNDGSYRPRYTQKDAYGKILYQVTSHKPIQAGKQLLVGIATQHRSVGQEFANTSSIIQRLVWDHYIRDKKTNSLSYQVHIADNAPAKPSLQEDEYIIWIDRNDGNRAKTLRDNSWEYLHGDISEYMSCFTGALAKEEGMYKSRYLGTNVVPEKSFRIYLAPNPQKLPHKPAPQNGDYILFARSSALDFNLQETLGGRFENGKWEIGGRIPHTMMYTLHGDVRCYFRIGGEESIREPDWIWSNLQPDLQAQTYIAKPEGEGGGKLVPVAIGTKEISTFFKVLDPSHVNVYAMVPEVKGRTLLTPNTDYQVDNSGERTKIVLSKALGSANHRVFIEPAIPYAALDDYDRDHAIPRGRLLLGKKHPNGFTGTVNYFEARRQRGVTNETQSIEVPSTGIQHRFKRRPVNPKTGERDTPVFPAASVWLVAK